MLVSCFFRAQLEICAQAFPFAFVLVVLLILCCLLFCDGFFALVIVAIFLFPPFAVMIYTTHRLGSFLPFSVLFFVSPIWWGFSAAVVQSRVCIAAPRVVVVMSEQARLRFKLVVDCPAIYYRSR